MVAAENLHPLKDAPVGHFDFAETEVGDGFKFGGDTGKHFACGGNFPKADGFVPEPFPQPAGFQRVGIEPQNKKCILTGAMAAVLTVRVAILLVAEPAELVAVTV